MGEWLNKMIKEQDIVINSLADSDESLMRYYQGKKVAYMKALEQLNKL